MFNLSDFLKVDPTKVLQVKTLLILYLFTPYCTIRSKYVYYYKLSTKFYTSIKFISEDGYSFHVTTTF